MACSCIQGHVPRSAVCCRGSGPLRCLAVCTCHTSHLLDMMAPACRCPALQVRATATVVDPKKAKAEQEKAEAERIRVRPGEAGPPALWARFHNARSRWLGALHCAGMDTCLLVCPLWHLWMRALFLLLSPLCTCSSDIDLLPLLVRQAREKLEERQAKTMRKFSVPRWRSSAPQTLNAGVMGGAGGEEAVMELQAVRCLVPGRRGGQGCTLRTRMSYGGRRACWRRHTWPRSACRGTRRTCFPHPISPTCRLPGGGRGCGGGGAGRGHAGGAATAHAGRPRQVCLPVQSERPGGRRHALPACNAVDTVMTHIRPSCPPPTAQSSAPPFPVTPGMTRLRRRQQRHDWRPQRRVRFLAASGGGSRRMKTRMKTSAARKKRTRRR